MIEILQHVAWKLVDIVNLKCIGKYMTEFPGLWPNMIQISK